MVPAATERRKARATVDLPAPAPEARAPEMVPAPTRPPHEQEAHPHQEANQASEQPATAPKAPVPPAPEETRNPSVAAGSSAENRAKRSAPHARANHYGMTAIEQPRAT